VFDLGPLFVPQVPHGAAGWLVPAAGPLGAWTKGVRETGTSTVGGQKFL